MIIEAGCLPAGASVSFTTSMSFALPWMMWSWASRVVDGMLYWVSMRFRSLTGVLATA